MEAEGRGQLRLLPPTFLHSNLFMQLDAVACTFAVVSTPAPELFPRRLSSKHCGSSLLVPRAPQGQAAPYQSWPGAWAAKSPRAGRMQALYPCVSAVVFWLTVCQPRPGRQQAVSRKQPMVLFLLQSDFFFLP